jgi:NADH dehydrogenase FAD-containing subunit
LDKKVVIVGASFAGLNLAEQLWDDFEVIIIDKNNYFEYICTATRSLIEEEHNDQISLSYSQMMRAHAKKASFIQGELE